MHILRCACSRTSFEGEDATVSIHEKLLKLNIPPAPFKGGVVTVNIHEH